MVICVQGSWRAGQAWSYNREPTAQRTDASPDYLGSPERHSRCIIKHRHLRQFRHSALSFTLIYATASLPPSSCLSNLHASHYVGSRQGKDRQEVRQPVLQGWPAVPCGPRRTVRCLGQSESLWMATSQLLAACLPV